MRHTNIRRLVVVLGVVLTGTLAPLRADHDDEHERHEGQRLKPVPSGTYQEFCSLCHPAYHPALLPAKSWEKIVCSMKEHHGEELTLDAKVQQEILAFLQQQAADKSTAELPRKIMKSLRGETPTRITDVPAIQREHRKLGDDVFKRKGIGSRANCAACHQAAARGDFDEDSVRVPRQ